MTQYNDPVGQVCKDYLNGQLKARVLVKSDFVSDDYLPGKHLFRSFNEMPLLEQKAMTLSRGRVLDIGAGAGAHSLYLQEKGLDVVALEISPMACEVMKIRGVRQIENCEFFSWQTTQTFDTILMLMNGVGMGGELGRMADLFKKAKQLLTAGGQLLVDSSDLCYLFDDEDTEDLPEEMDHYYGEVNYQMSYKEHRSDWFKWLFIDPKMLAATAQQNGFRCEILLDGGHYDYLAKLTVR